MSAQWQELWKEHPGSFNAWPNEELVRWARTLESWSRVLEVGCGNGANLRALRTFVAHAVGVDVAEEALLYANGLSCELHQASATSLPFEDGSFDAVADVQCLQHLASDELATAYAEIHRVLHPGGRFFSMVLVAGQQYFPALQFNGLAGLPDFGLLDAGFKITDDYLATRSPGGRFYAYRVLECERV